MKKLLIVLTITLAMLGSLVYASESYFNDLEGYSWAEEYINEFAEKKVVSGVSEDKFEPGREVKREEFVKVIINLFEYDPYNAESNFEDVSKDAWYYPYVSAAVKEGIRVVGVPGCCAAVNALSISGFDLSSFLFFGFFPRENADRKKLLEKMRRGDTKTFAFYESPKRIMDLVEFFLAVEAQVQMCLCNDMTKLHEMTFRGTPSEVKEQLLAKGNYEKGEYAVIVEVADGYLFRKEEHAVSAEALLIDSMVTQSISNVKDAVAAVLSDENNSYSKNELKAAALNLKKLFS